MSKEKLKKKDVENPKEKVELPWIRKENKKNESGVLELNQNVSKEEKIEELEKSYERLKTREYKKSLENIEN
jgi:molecular chaperone GrpE (heat shock protein)